MSKIEPHLYAPETNAVRAGQRRTDEGENSEALFLSSSFVFESAAEAAARFAGEEEGNVYSRFTNPTVRTFEERLASLEGAQRAIATSSGMSAILTTCMALLKSGDHIVSSSSIFGTSVNLFSKILPSFGIHTSFVDLADYEAWEKAISPSTRILFLETPTNPLMELADIRVIADLARRNGCLLVVDNCFCTPVLQRPLELGADIVIHSATKYLDGQGRCVGGAVLGDEELLGEDIFGFLRTAGPSMSPFNAWVFLKGLETLSIRMKEHCRNAQVVADWLAEQPGIEHVYYPGLASHPQHELAQRQQRGFGGVVSLDVEGGREAAWKFIDATEFFSITANLGDAKTTITHPATTTHGRISDEERQAAGIGEGLIRLSVGLEDAEDILRDLEKGLIASRS